MKKRAKKAKSRKRSVRIAKPAVELFIKGVLVRGEAAKAVKGKLPPGVTHEIVGKAADGLPIIKRRRFSIA